MQNHNPQVDAYIAAAAPFAQPILRRLRKLFHQAHPGIAEEMKWNTPHFVYGGIVASMAAFKQHVRFGFWKGKQLRDQFDGLEIMGATDMSIAKITKTSDLPPDKTLIAMIQAAVKLNDEARNAAPAKKRAKAKVGASLKTARKLTVPKYLREAIAKNKKAQATFDGFSYSHKKEYVEWITDAKRDDTRAKRIQQAIAWLAEGKPRNWKYQNC